MARQHLSVSQARQNLQESGAQEGNPGILVFALIGAALFMTFYYHFLVLNQLPQLTGGIPMLDQRPLGYSVEDVKTLASAMDQDALGQLNWVHKTAGVLFPLFAAGASIAVTVWSTASKPARIITTVAAIIFFIVDIAENIVIEHALVNQDLAATASVLTVTRWWILFAMIAWAVLLLGNKLRAKIRTSIDEVIANG